VRFQGFLPPTPCFPPLYPIVRRDSLRRTLAPALAAGDLLCGLIYWLRRGQAH
jgi:hypothetical protein